MRSGHSLNIPNLKAQARRYRAVHEGQGKPTSHSRALELVARQNGFRDWNTAAAQGRTVPVPSRFRAGTSINGRYLGVSFSATVLASSQLDDATIRVTLDLWEPIDPVTSMKFSSLRKRISGTIGVDGKSVDRISTGAPVLEIEARDDS